MSSFQADLIVVNVSPYRLAEAGSVGEVRGVLEGISKVAKAVLSSQLSSAWRLHGASEGGVPSPLPDFPGLVHAPVAGIGIEHWDAATVTSERDIEAERARLLATVRRIARTPLDRVRLLRTAARQLDRKRRVLDEGSRRRELLHRIAEEAGRASRMPLRVESLHAEQRYDFEEAYRRRIAFALAHEVFRGTGEVDPLLSYYERLHHGTLRDLRDMLPPPDSPLAFSLDLNLLAKLDRAEALDRRNGQAPSSDHEERRRVVQHALQESARAREARLGADGKLAVAALLCEVEMHRGIWGAEVPRWGKFAERKHYVLPGETSPTS